MNPTPKGWPRISQSAFYKDPQRMIDWLCAAFGFELRLKVDGEAGKLVHSELVLPGGLVMVGGEHGTGDASDPVRKDFVAPASVGGGNTQNMFVYVDDIDAHCARARAAGATITIEPAVSDYGEDHWADRGYECIDAGGHRWWFAQRLSTGATFTPKLDAGDLGPSAPPPKGWPRISSGLYYTDPHAAIDWLCEAFGFEVQIKVEGEAGALVHSELVYGGGLVMVSDCARDGAKWPHRKAPREIGNANTQSLFVHVDDAKAHHARAVAAGAEVIQDLKVSDYGEAYWSDLGYGARDIGGHQWWFSQRLRG
ncbi:MAG TPA: VOC family protein [Kofleriaceae bacterium]|nr:VOC family protein [Kofleriaceae bacterium]